MEKKETVEKLVRRAEALKEVLGAIRHETRDLEDRGVNLGIDRKYLRHLWDSETKFRTELRNWAEHYNSVLELALSYIEKKNTFRPLPSIEIKFEDGSFIRPEITKDFSRSITKLIFALKIALDSPEPVSQPEISGRSLKIKGLKNLTLDSEDLGKFSPLVLAFFKVLIALKGIDNEHHSWDTIRGRMAKVLGHEVKTRDASELFRKQKNKNSKWAYENLVDRQIGKFKLRCKAPN